MKKQFLKPSILVLILVAFLVSCNSVSEPLEPMGPIPNAHQLDWQELEYYAFIHLT